MHSHMCTDTSAQTHLHSHMCTQTRTLTHMHSYTCIHPRALTRIHSNTFALTHVNWHTCTKTGALTRIHSRTCTNTHALTITPTCACPLMIQMPAHTYTIKRCTTTYTHAHKHKCTNTRSRPHVHTCTLPRSSLGKVAIVWHSSFILFFCSSASRPAGRVKLKPARWRCWAVIHRWVLLIEQHPSEWVTLEESKQAWIVHAAAEIHLHSCFFVALNMQKQPDQLSMLTAPQKKQKVRLADDDPLLLWA